MRATRRKTTKVKSTASARRAKGHSKEQIAKDNWRAALNRAKEIESAWRHKFAQKSAEFKHKLTEAAEHAYAKAVDYINQEQAKRLVAQKKALATAMAKFEKKFAKKTAKTTKRGRKTTKSKNKVNSLVGKQLTTTKSTGKKRGRKPGKRQIAKATHTTHATTRTTTGKKRGRKPGKKTAVSTGNSTRTLHTTTGKKRGRKPTRKTTKKATIQVSSRRVSSTPVRRGRPPKRRSNVLTNNMGAYRGTYAL